MAEKPAGHGGDRHTSDNLLQLIAQKEHELEAQLQTARDEAAALVAQARAEGERIRRQAADQAAQLSREHQERTVADAARVQRDAEMKAATDVDALRRQAAGRLDAAVHFVIERVIKD